MVMKLFNRLSKKISYTFAVAFISTSWVYLAGAYGFYIFYATSNITGSELMTAFTTFVLSIMAGIICHYVQYGLLHKFGFSGFTGSIGLINRYMDDDFIMKEYQTIESERLVFIYEKIVRLTRNNFVSASVYTLIVILVLIIVLYFKSNGFSFMVYILLAGLFAILIHGFFVFNITDYLTGPVKEKMQERIYLKTGKMYSAHLSSYRHKSYFTILLIFLCMIILFIYIRTSEKSVLQIFLFILLSVSAIGYLIYLSMTSINLALSKINNAAQNLAAGGPGFFFSSFSGRELIQFSRNYNSAAMEIYEIRSDLEKKIQDRTAELRDAYKKLDNAYGQIQNDLNLARKIQNRLLPHGTARIKGVNVKIHYSPMSKIGGDIYDIFEHEKGVIRVFIADAVGHGVQAALVTMIIKSEYESCKRTAGPAELLTRLNAVFNDTYGNLDVFFSCFVTDIDIASREIRYASAGHPDQYIISGNDAITLSHTGKLIGIICGADYGEHVVSIKCGARLLLFTDGLYERFNSHDQPFGEKKLRDLIEDNKAVELNMLIDDIITAVNRFSGAGIEIEMPTDDDVTLIGIEID